jgi:hypothetical protein
MPNSVSSELPLRAIPPLSALSYTPRFSQSYLDELRRRGDPLADEVVGRLAAEAPLTRYTDLLGEVRARAAKEGSVYRELLEAGNTVPAWADFRRMREGQRVIAAFPMHMGLSLFSGSLVGGAVFQKMALVTAMTGMLSGDSTRRLDETAAMVLRMSFPGTIEPGGEAHELWMRVRLLHGAVRRHLRDTGRFKHPTEVPVNQQDLAVTLALFGYVNVRSLAMMGIDLNARERDSYMLLFRYAGHVLGIDDDLLPHSLEEQREFFFASLKHQARPEKLTPQTRCVMDNLAREATAARKLVPYGVAQQFLYQACRFLSGNEYVTGMQIEDAGDDYWGIRLLKGLGRAHHVTWRYLPYGKRLLCRAGHRNFERSLSRMHARKDAEGEYRMRTAEHSAHRAEQPA